MDIFLIGTVVYQNGITINGCVDRILYLVVIGPFEIRIVIVDDPGFSTRLSGSQEKYN